MALPSRRLNAPGPPAAIAAKAITAGNRINLFEFKTSVSVQKLYATAAIKNRILGSRQFEEHPPSKSLYRLTSAGLADVIELIMDQVRTDILEIAFEQGGPATGKPVLLLHGWPDAPRGWNQVARALQDDGWRTVTPYLRGSSPTRCLSTETPRVGSGVALAQDAVDLADALGLNQFAVLGHDWGARAAYILAALFPERVTAIAALALGYQPRGVFKIPPFEQSRRFWYQWFMCTPGGAEAVRKDPVGFARIQWDTWSPAGWFDQQEFTRTAETFSNPDWAAITLNGYRSRWLPGEASDDRYNALQQRLAEIENLSTPTLMIQGLEDYCDPPSESEGREKYFTGGYRRLTLENVGHFPHREAPEPVAAAVLDHFRGNTAAKATKV
jgi:pimeloyl-ACP methyl ester carboxylesterase